MSEEAKDVTPLEAKRDELLAETKDLKKRLKEVTDERDGAIARAETAEGEVQQLRIDNPVDEMLKDVFTVPPERARKLIESDFEFKLSEDGLGMFKDGEKVAGFDAKEISEVLSAHGLDSVIVGTRASGAGGSSKAVETVRPRETPEQPRQFGLQ